MPNPQIYESAVSEAAAGKIIHKRLLQWVEEVAVTCKPDRVHICDGSEQEYQLMMRTDASKRHRRGAESSKTS